MLDLSQRAAMDAAYGEAACRTRSEPSRSAFEALAAKLHKWTPDTFARWARGRLWSA